MLLCHCQILSRQGEAGNLQESGKGGREQVPGMLGAVPLVSALHSVLCFGAGVTAESC